MPLLTSFKRRFSKSSINLKQNQDKEAKSSPTDKFLLANNPKCVANKGELKLMLWMFGRQQAIPSKTGSITHIKRISNSEKAHLSRKRPQWISSYYACDKTLLIWLYGTHSDWDWLNLLNVRHKEIHLHKPHTHSIKVHAGIYALINSPLFYAPLFADIHIHFSDTKNQEIDKVIFGGHSQGGGIAQLMFLLLHGAVDCEFVNYFTQRQAELARETEIDLNISNVYTLGSISVISHNSMIYVDNIFGDKITNVINSIDVIPPMFGGNKREPKQALKGVKNLSLGRFAINQYGKSVMKNFAKVASFGPIGKYIVFVGNELRVLQRKDDGLMLFHLHLVHGAKTYLATNVKFREMDILKKIQKGHLYHTYKAHLDRILAKYITDIDKQTVS